MNHATPFTLNEIHNKSILSGVKIGVLFCIKTPLLLIFSHDISYRRNSLVGSHLLYQICKSETKVRAIKRAQSNTSLVRQIFLTTLKADLLFKIEWVNADLLNIPELELAFQGVTKYITVHLGSDSNQKHKNK